MFTRLVNYVHSSIPVNSDYDPEDITKYSFIMKFIEQLFGSSHHNHIRITQPNTITDQTCSGGLLPVHSLTLEKVLLSPSQTKPVNNTPLFRHFAF